MSIVQAQKKRRGNNNEVAVRLPSSSIATSGPGSGLQALQEEDDEEPRVVAWDAPRCPLVSLGGGPIRGRNADRPSQLFAEAKC